MQDILEEIPEGVKVSFSMVRVKGSQEVRLSIVVGPTRKIEVPGLKDLPLLALRGMPRKVAADLSSNRTRGEVSRRITMVAEALGGGESPLPPPPAVPEPEQPMLPEDHKAKALNFIRLARARMAIRDRVTARTLIGKARQTIVENGLLSNPDVVEIYKAVLAEFKEQ